jgi:hypothetical protein
MLKLFMVKFFWACSKERSDPEPHQNSATLICNTLLKAYFSVFIGGFWKILPFTVLVTRDGR